MGRRLTAIDVCSGAGGWACAARGLPIDIVAAIDVDMLALRTYKLNHPDTDCICADVRQFDFRRFGHVDLVLGGIPCEEISQARSRRPASVDTMNAWQRLLDACLAVPGAVGARWWCYEDVIQVQRYLPPRTPCRILNSRAWSAQNRRRAYVGSFPALPIGTDRRVLRSCLRPGPYRVTPGILRGRPMRADHYSHSGGFYPWTPGRKSPCARPLPSRRDKEAAVVDGALRRQVEWQELATLQGFPPDYVFVGSPTHVHTLVGQAVQIDTALAILEAICTEALIDPNPVHPVHPC